MTRTSSEPDPDDDYQPRKFNRFYNRSGNEALRSLKIPVDILDRLEQFKQQNNLDQEQIAAAAESGSEVATEVNEELIHVKMLAMEGLIVQQGLSSLAKTQAEVEQQQKVFDRNKQLVRRNQELEVYVKQLVIPLTWMQLNSALPYIGIASLCLAAVIIFSSHGRNTNPSTPANPPTVQPEVVPSVEPSSGG
jgi:hypothetical protein